MITGGDFVLKTLSQTQGIISNYISQFLMANHEVDTSNLVDKWFRSRIQIYFDNIQEVEKKSIDITSIDFKIPDILQKKTRLVSIQPNYFRGFRKHENPVNLQGDLIVLDGRNSSGKTSLAEAIEWLISGHICRRETGDPKELAECVANRFKPNDEETWVELLLDQDGQIQTIKRVLVKDYDTKKNSACETKLIINDKELTPETTPDILEQFFSGILPLLMQHTLRSFVLDSPEKRRDYFEQLLSLDRITSLIEKSVVSDSRLDDFPNKSGSTMLAEWIGLKNFTSDKNIFRRLERENAPQMRITFQEILTKIAADEFDQDTDLSLEKMVENIQMLQRSVRQQNFPLLEKLRPKRTLDEAMLEQLSVNNYGFLIQRLLQAQSEYKTAQLSAQTISNAQIAISKSLENLREMGLILDSIDDQTCPLCEYSDIPTLTKDRVNQISAWEPIQKAVSISRQNYERMSEEVLRIVEDLRTIRYNLLPKSFSDKEWFTVSDFLDDPNLIYLRTELDEADATLQMFDSNVILFLSTPIRVDDDENILYKDFQDIVSLLPTIVEHARIYSSRFSDFENYLGVVSSQDKNYTTRELWLNVVEKTEVLLLDLQWEIAKKKAQQELSLIRDTLISIRQKYLEARRFDFSVGISEIWNKLRADQYSVFDKLYIPDPRGRGFPVKIEVKALLDNNSETHEVDALGFFSESQINAIGIAAFVTRSKLMGHSCLIFDDPVQSMDEEHFKTFATNVLSHLCDDGFQVIVLTHSDMFAREISYAHSDRINYVTMKIENSRRKGCRVEEGNRRVAERLDRALSCADDGNLERAWYFIRLAIERLYTIVQIKHGPVGFNPSSWANHTTDSMWKESVGNIVKSLIPESAERLHDILKMTVGGTHDKAPEGNTNLINAVKDIRPLLSKLHVGG